MLAGRYEMDRELGRGGMGAVWLAHDTVLGRTVAVKKIGMAPGGGAADFDRAEREAHLAARVNHQNVVAVFDLVADGGSQWLVMEHVEGPTLGGLVAQRGAIEPEELAPLVEQVAGALAAAHDHGIVHRDVKPSNILLTHDGVAKLSDFGVARAQADASLTQTGLVTGSPAYLAPEVATGRTATSASDVWSLGATVFHALAGRAPYEVGDNVLGAMYRIVNNEPPRLEDGGRLGPLVASMMQKDPDARPTMTEIEQTLVAGAGTAEAVTRTQLLVPPGTATQALDPEETQGFAALAEDDPTPTSAFRPLAAPLPESDPAPGSGADHRAASTRRNLWLGAAVAAAVAAVVLVALLVGGGEDEETPRADPAPAQTSDPAPEEAPDSPAEPESPTAEQLADFAGSYPGTASSNPEAGFALLTSAYQQESGGLEGYERFWGRVSEVDVQDVRADPENLTATYTYRYVHDGAGYTETVTLLLEESGDGFLIRGTG